MDFKNVPETHPDIIQFLNNNNFGIKPEVMRPLGRPRRRWEDNIKMDLRETGWDGMEWIDLAQDRDQ
jgi:hypothetical protein